MRWNYFTAALLVTTGARAGWGQIAEPPEELFPVPPEMQKQIFQRANKTPNNLVYVGCGYDMYGGNRIDDQTGFSLSNYRAPLLDSHYIAKGSNGGQFDDLGIWVSNEFVCGMSTERTAVNHQQTLKSMIESNYKFVTSNLYESETAITSELEQILHKLERDRNVVVKKYRCTVYSAGLIGASTARNMKRFHRAVKKLVTQCSGAFKEDECPLERYKTNAGEGGCRTCVGPWMRFFADFGTHTTSRITMGGIIRIFETQFQKAAERKYSNSSTTLKLSTTFFHLKESRDTSEHNDHGASSRDGKDATIAQYTVGPEPSDDTLEPKVFEDWVRRVAHNPVPIMVDFMPLGELMQGEEAITLYKSAVKYYARLKGFDPNGKDITTQTFRSSLLNLLKQSRIVAQNGPQHVNKDVCPGDSRILFGLGVNLNEKRLILELKACYAGMNACILDQNKDVTSSFIIAFCGESTDYDLTQRITKGRGGANTYDEVLCPKGSAVGFGIIVQLDNPMVIRSCPKGSRGCGFRNLGPSGLIWVTCFPATEFGFNLFKIKTGVLGPHTKMSCNDGQMLVNGFAFEDSSHGKPVNVAPCRKHENSCHTDLQDDAATAVYLICTN